MFIIFRLRDDRFPCSHGHRQRRSHCPRPRRGEYSALILLVEFVYLWANPYRMLKKLDEIDISCTLRGRPRCIRVCCPVHPVGKTRRSKRVSFAAPAAMKWGNMLCSGCCRRGLRFLTPSRRPGPADRGRLSIYAGPPCPHIDCWVTTVTRTFWTGCRNSCWVWKAGISW